MKSIPIYPEKTAIRVSGIESCRALYQRRPDDIQRVFILKPAQSEFTDLLAWCEQRRRPCHLVTLEELNTIAETVRHDGICFFARKKAPLDEHQLVGKLGARPGPQALVLIDNVKNPNNVGAIARTCAYFGVRGLLTCGDTPGLSTAAMRTAQGGAEAIDIVPLRKPVAILRSLKKCGFSLVATSSHAGQQFGSTPLPKRVLFMLGSENAGLSPDLLREADLELSIPGGGALESLNIASAASILVWEHWRTHRAHEALPAPPSTAQKRRHGSKTGPE